MLGGDAGGPAFDRRALDLDGASAPSAHEVVVVRGGAAAVDGFTVVGAQHVDGAVPGERLQGAVHRCEADRLTVGAQLRVQILRGAELAAAVEPLGDGALLEALHSHTSVVMQPDFDDRRYGGMNPYALGFAMMEDIERICREPTEEDREWFPDIAGRGDGMGSRRPRVVSARGSRACGPCVRASAAGGSGIRRTVP